MWLRALYVDLVKNSSYKGAKMRWVAMWFADATKPRHACPMWGFKRVLAEMSADAGWH